MMRDKKTWLMIILMTLIAALLVGWRAPQNKPRGWEYKIVPVNNVAQGEQVLKDMDNQGWEFVAVQPVRVQAELKPRIQLVQNTTPIQIEAESPVEALEAKYFFRRAK